MGNIKKSPMHTSTLPNSRVNIDRPTELCAGLDDGPSCVLDASNQETVAMGTEAVLENPHEGRAQVVEGQVTDVRRVPGVAKASLQTREKDDNNDYISTSMNTITNLE